MAMQATAGEFMMQPDEEMDWQEVRPVTKGDDLVRAGVVINISTRRHGVFHTLVSLRGEALEWAIRHKVERVRVAVGGRNANYLKITSDPDGPYKLGFGPSGKGVRIIRMGSVPLWPQAERSQEKAVGVDVFDTHLLIELRADFAQPERDGSSSPLVKLAAKASSGAVHRSSDADHRSSGAVHRSSGDGVSTTGHTPVMAIGVAKFSAAQAAVLRVLLDMQYAPNSALERAANCAPADVKKFMDQLLVLANLAGLTISNSRLGYRLSAADKARVRKALDAHKRGAS